MFNFNFLIVHEPGYTAQSNGETLIIYYTTEEKQSLCLTAWIANYCHLDVTARAACVCGSLHNNNQKAWIRVIFSHI